MTDMTEAERARRTIEAIAHSTGLTVNHIVTTWTADDFREWARVERIRALSDRDQGYAQADHYESLADGAGEA